MLMRCKGEMIMKVYAIEVQFENYEKYEDYDKWNYIYKVFNSRENANNYLSNVDEVIREVVKQDETCKRYLALSPDQPIQIRKCNCPNSYDICAHDEIIADDGNTILGYKERDWEDIDDWDKLFVHFDIQEWVVE
jgi:hypothetical protein